MSSTSFDPLSLTCYDFAQAVEKHLGKGRIQARALYRQWHLTGQLTGSDPCFKNAPVLKEKIASLFALPHLLPKQIQQEGDTIKFTLPLDDGYETESVLIPMKAGITLCLSSQVGCRMGCKFCETGRLGLIRNLTTHEIVRQLAAAKHHFGATVRSIVFMGMGEPMDNIDAIIPAIEIFSDPSAFNIARRHITVSTSGHLEGLELFCQRVHPPVNLAVSVIASDDETRTRLMPVNRRWNMAQLYEAMARYNERTKRLVLIEYVLLQDVNDSEEAAHRLALYLKGLDVKVNLIPYNAQSRLLARSDQPFHPSSPEKAQQFAKVLQTHGVRTLLRARKGHDIMAACGQLGNLKWRLMKREGTLSLPQIDC